MLFNLWQKKGSNISRWFDCERVWVSYGLMLNEENLHFIHFVPFAGSAIWKNTISADWLTRWLVEWSEW